MGTARKILAALREPSNAMIRSAQGYDIYDYTIRRTWQRMIDRLIADTALTEENE